ncbi:hypothetical protein Mmc1_2855 [Magnetococcus marinus MC-1]|uniref:Uncharacterized protein n=1 Tax=Magnetococcus marinus (strain ATCC BAA-1437 / JCM 17883 / MC-1) TaxID=156889 RepID=A0LAW8_MAGMM|nr:hypothetical protein [Magnetococcus marinus]ABK45111.1 hypothetical protein Mmc1_2615 [Magnetococcus marinus MC-1]ABK45348.1 hypothetical protein Mmc1_2855 [Magnetococcus marinus MC-1]
MRGIHPDLLTAEERLDEIAEILANGVLRFLEKRNSRTSLNKQQKPLDSVSEQSVYGDQSIPQKQGDEHHDQ